jgi:hypothetical protein
MQRLEWLIGAVLVAGAPDRSRRRGREAAASRCCNRSECGRREGALSQHSQVKADPKSFDLLDLHGPVLIQGKIRSPQISIGRVIPIPTPSFGDAKTVACDATTRQLFSTQ